MAGFDHFFAELKRRNVLRVITAYAVFSFVVLQLCDILFPGFGIPDAVISWVVAGLLIIAPLVVLFAWFFELTEEGLKPTTEVSKEASITKTTGRRVNIAIAGLVVVAALFAGYQFLLPEAETPTSASTPTLTTDDRPSVAVLPFVNMSSDQENEYFSDGLTEEVLNVLAQVNSLRVAARTSSFFYKGKNENLQQVAAALNVGHILEGSVRKSGNTLRITAQLINAADGFHVWSRTFDREIKDVFSVQDEIAAEVTRGLRVSLLEEPTEKQRTQNLVAYDLYLRARQLLNARQMEPVKRSLDLFQQAAELDPNWPAPVLGVATSAIVLYNNYRGIPRLEAQQQAKEALDKAFELGALDSQYYATLGLYESIKAVEDPNAVGAAKQAFEQAIELNPNNAQAHFWYAALLSDFGTGKERLQGALEMNEKALKLDPLNRVANVNQVSFLANLGRIEEATGFLNHLIRIDADHFPYRLFKVGILLESYQLVEAMKLLADLPINIPARSFMPFNTLTALNRADLAPDLLAALSEDNPQLPDLVEFIELEQASLEYLEAKARNRLLAPDPNFEANQLVYTLVRRNRPELVRALIENARPDFAKGLQVTRFVGEPVLPYTWSLKQTGEVERAAEYAQALLDENADTPVMGRTGIGLSRAICLMLLDDLEGARQEIAQALDAGWRTYYSDIHSWPLFEPILDTPELQRAKQLADELIADKGTAVVDVMYETGLLKRSASI